jgi:PadR family transcriptional regulator PadR
VLQPFEILNDLKRSHKTARHPIHANRVQIARNLLRLHTLAGCIDRTIALLADFFYIVEQMSSGNPIRSLGEFERAVLLAVSRLRDTAYGVAIRVELEQRLSRPVSLGSVYTTLDRLLAKGLVSTSPGEPTPERGGRAKKFFAIEARGLEALEQARRATEAMWAIDPVVSTQ